MTRKVTGLSLLALLPILFLIIAAACGSGRDDNGVGQLVKTDDGSYVDITPPVAIVQLPTQQQLGQLHPPPPRGPGGGWLTV